jgi:PIN domain nuclease of toxin-antitoxin system
VKYVLDSNAVIAFFDGEHGSVVIRDILMSPAHDVTIHSINLCEAFYHFWRNENHRTANKVLRDLIALGVESYDDLGPTLWKLAAALKTRYKRLAIGDAIGVSLAMATRGTFVTADEKELRPLANDRVCKFLFFR